MRVAVIVKKSYNGEIIVDLINSSKIDLDKINFLPKITEVGSAYLDLKEMLIKTPGFQSVIKSHKLKVFDLNKKKLCQSIEKIVLEIGKQFDIKEIKSYAFQEIQKRPNDKEELCYIKLNMLY